MLSELMLDWHYMDILYATWLECMLVYFKAAKGPSPSLVHDSLELYRSSTFFVSYWWEQTAEASNETLICH